MPTIYDVAKRAKVSPATVSNAFNKPHLIKPDTHARILQAARELDYRPNLFAKALAGGQTQMVGLLVPDIRYPYTATLARGIEDVLAAEGYMALITSTDGQPDKEQTLIRQLLQRGVDGFILTPAQFGLADKTMHLLEQVVAQGVPVVVAGEEVSDEHERIGYVAFRSQAGTRAAIDYLVSLGHGQIAFVGGRYTAGVAVSRWLGYQESLLNHRLPLRPELVIETDMTPADGMAALAQLLTLNEPPTAVFALNDLLAMGMIDYCYAHEIRLPEQLSIISFDYLPMAQRTTPAVSGVVIPAYEIGRQAAQALLAQYQNPEAPAQQLMLDYALAIRQTTAVPFQKS